MRNAATEATAVKRAEMYASADEICSSRVDPFFASAGSTSPSSSQCASMNTRQLLNTRLYSTVHSMSSASMTLTKKYVSSQHDGPCSACDRDALMPMIDTTTMRTDMARREMPSV